MSLLLQDNQTPEDHGIYIWRHFVQKAAARNIAIVAHSYGGIVTFTLVSLLKIGFINDPFWQTLCNTDTCSAFDYTAGKQNIM